MEPMTTMKVTNVRCLAVSQDGRWMAAGRLWGEVLVWDSKTSKKIYRFKEDNETILGVDFSPDSTRFVAAKHNGTAVVWERRLLGKKVQTFEHLEPLNTAKYSPLGDRIATATSSSVRVWDSNDGRLLVDIKAGVEPWHNTGLCWFKNHLFVVSHDEIKQFDASTGLEVSRWSTPESNNFSSIILSQRGEFIAYSAGRTITFWDASTHTQLALINLSQGVNSIALSPDDQFLAICEKKKITIQSVSHITVSIVFFAL